jgi:mannosylglycerate hydrolase
MTDARLTVYVVPHTHWDREWYLPFQRFRLRLVEVVDAVLDLLEQQPGYRFTLDGQLAVVDDYLQIRPEAEPRIRRFAAEGRLALGPWQTLMDEFLVSGETIVRNLEAGLARAAELGAVMQVGYLPDMFGHVAQMPQLLARAGFRRAVVWRGVPAAIDRHAFRWEAPDGSAVRAEYLVGGYGNAAHVADDPDRFVAELRRLAAAGEPFFGRDEPLAMVGTDHMPPSRELPALVERANREQQRLHVRLATLGEYLDRDREDDRLPVWRGELRSGARANMLMGVNSARLDLRVACARAERLLTRVAEPLLALENGEWPAAFLREAWQRVLANSAHDSICGCSVDEVCDEVLVRFAGAEQIATGLVERTLADVGARAPDGWVAVHNPSPHARVGLTQVEMLVPEEWEAVSLGLPDGTRLPAQEAGRTTAELHVVHLTGARLLDLLGWLHGRELFGGQVNSYEVDVPARRVLFAVDQIAGPDPFNVERLERELRAAAAAAPEARFQVRIVTTPRRRLLALVPAPALGWTFVRAVEGAGEVESPVRATDRSLTNDLVSVSVAVDGTLEVVGGGASLTGVGRLVDGGDAGDSYNYAPPPRDTLVNTPESVSVEVRAAGPVVGELAVVRTYRWPRGLDAGAAVRSEETAAVDVTTAVELRMGESFLRLRVTFENPSTDHRLRLHVPLAWPAECSFAEGQFAVVERCGPPEGGHGEMPLATYPAHGFVDAGGVALLLEHPSEYELIHGRELALTLLRSTGLISRNDNPYRDEPAGPQIAIPGAQLRGPWSTAFGLYPHAGSWSEADTTAVLERYLHSFLTVPGTGSPGPPPAPRPGLELSGPGVVLSSLRRYGEELELRLVCERVGPATAVVSGRFSAARETDLLGRPGPELEPGPGGLELELGPWEIRTLLLRR